MESLLKNRFIVAGVLLLLIFLGINYYNSTKDDEIVTEVKTPENSLSTVKVSAVKPGGLFGILSVAKNRGFDKEEKFVFEIVETTPADATTTLLAGGVDMGQVSPIQMIKVNEEGNDLKIIAPGFKLGCVFAVRKDSPYESWKDLKGKKVGTLAPTSGTYLALATAMKQAGYNLEDYYQVQSLPFPGLVPGLVQKKVEAIIAPCDEGSVAQVLTTQDVKVIGYLSDIMKETSLDEKLEGQLAMISAQSSWINDNKDLASSVNKVIYKSIQYLKDHPEEFDNLETRAVFAIETEEQANLVKEFSKNFYHDVLTWDDMKKDILSFLKASKDAGLIKSVPSEDVFIDLQK